jgi:uncharacterized membrane protein (UPF0127 family)
MNVTTGKEIAASLSTAENLLRRMKGLLGRESLRSGEGLLIIPCMGIHTIAMRFPIDVLFIDKRNIVIAAIRNIRPNRLTRLYPGASGVIELPVGTLDATETKAGDLIEFS